VLLGEPLRRDPISSCWFSGGHTELIPAVDWVGPTPAWAAAMTTPPPEAFDKVARLLGHGLPKVARRSRRRQAQRRPLRFRFPQGRVSRPDGGFLSPMTSASVASRPRCCALTRKLANGESTGPAGEAALPIADLAASFEHGVADGPGGAQLPLRQGTNGLGTLVLVGGWPPIAACASGLAIVVRSSAWDLAGVAPMAYLHRQRSHDRRGGDPAPLPVAFRSFHSPGGGGATAPWKARAIFLLCPALSFSFP